MAPGGDSGVGGETTSSFSSGSEKSEPPAFTVIPSVIPSVIPAQSSARLSRTGRTGLGGSSRHGSRHGSQVDLAARAEAEEAAYVYESRPRVNSQTYRYGSLTLYLKGKVDNIKYST